MDNEQKLEITPKFLEECINSVPLTCSECGMLNFEGEGKKCPFCGK